MAETDAPLVVGAGLWSGSELSPSNSGLSITNQRSALTQGVNGVANDLGSQSDDVTTGLDAIIAAITAKPSE